MRRFLLLLAVGTLFGVLTGCAQDLAVRAACTPVKAYSAAEQQQLAQELAALPAGSALAGAMVDYGRMRDAARACGLPHP